jgi:hypothetical protein
MYSYSLLNYVTGLEHKLGPRPDLLIQLCCLMNTLATLANLCYFAKTDPKLRPWGQHTINNEAWVA